MNIDQASSAFSCKDDVDFDTDAIVASPETAMCDGGGCDMFDCTLSQLHPVQDVRQQPYIVCLR